MMLNRWIWLPLIHIMKHMKPMFLSVPVARPYSALCFASMMPRSLAGDDALAACRPTIAPLRGCPCTRVQALRALPCLAPLQ